MNIYYEENNINCLELENTYSNEAQSNTRSSEVFVKRIDNLVKNIEKSNEYKEINERYNYYLGEIEKVIPGNNRDLIMKLDDCYTEMLILHDEYFYKCGFIDRKKKTETLKKILSWIKAKTNKLFGN